MSGLRTSLRCLQHPLTWLSIALLLLNDHLLKTVAPSWLTGKLSDFAGLFFFPFLLAAELSLLLDRLRWPARRIGGIAFALAGVWFLLLKTSPWANALTSDLASRLLDRPAHFALDPTDLLALGVLWPAWRLWDCPTIAHPQRVAWVALAVGALASLATSPLPPAPHIDRLFFDGRLYAADTDEQTLAISTDGGRTWEMFHEGHFEDMEYFQRLHASGYPTGTAELPLQLCSPTAPQYCYRIAGQEEVNASTDGGRSWETAWSIPPGRRSFMRRWAGMRWWAGREPDPDLTPRDLIIFEWDGASYLLAAMGREGVLRQRIPDGEWERLAVSYVQPTPYREEHIGEALELVSGEMGLARAAAFLTLLVSCALGWIGIRKQVKGPVPPSRSDWQVLRPVLIPVAVVCTILLLNNIPGSPFESIFGGSIWQIHGSLAVLAIVAVTVGLTIAGKRMAAESPNPQRITAIMAWCVLTSVCVFLVEAIPWLLWTQGTIAFYETALLIAVLLSLVVLAGGLYLVWRIGRRAVGSGRASQDRPNGSA